MDQLNRLKLVRTVATTLGFDHGKMHETDFVAMPRMSAEEKLERRLLGGAGANTFFYSTACIRWSESMLAPSAPVPLGLPAVLQRLTAALKAQGIGENDLRAAFGGELEVIGDWPPDSRWPVLQAMLPVKDPARARKIAEALTSVEVAGD